MIRFSSLPNFRNGFFSFLFFPPHLFVCFFSPPSFRKSSHPTSRNEIKRKGIYSSLRPRPLAARTWELLLTSAPGSSDQVCTLVQSRHLDFIIWTQHWKAHIWYPVQELAWMQTPTGARIRLGRGNWGGNNTDCHLLAAKKTPSAKDFLTPSSHKEVFEMPAFKLQIPMVAASIAALQYNWNEQHSHPSLLHSSGLIAEGLG